MNSAKLNGKFFFFSFLFIAFEILLTKPVFSGSENSTFVDGNILKSKDGVLEKTVKKSNKRHHHHKGKKIVIQTDQNSAAGSQEEVTDQREVSQQSDQKGRYKR